MSCCLDSSNISRNTQVEGEMDLLRIRTSDFGHNHTSVTSHLHDFKNEPPVSPTFSCNTSPASSTTSSTVSSISVKQEPNNNVSQNVANFLTIKTELPDPHFNDSQNTTNFKNCVALPISLTPTPTEDTSPDKLIVGSTSQFLPDCSNKNLFECVIYVKGDTTMLQKVEFFLDYETTDKQSFDVKPVVKMAAPFEIRQKFVSFQRVKILLFFKNLEKGSPIDPKMVILPVHIDSNKSGVVCQGLEKKVDYPPEVANDQREISKLASWLQAPPQRIQARSSTTAGVQLGDLPTTGNKILFHHPSDTFATLSSTQTAGGLLRSGHQGNMWPKSAPTSPQSPGSPTENRIIRSASSSPIRQTLLPNPCLRQKPFNRSASVGHSDPVLSSQNSQMVDGEPVAKRRPVTSIATLGPIRNGTAFTPISIPDASSNFSSIPFERIQESTLLNTSQEVQIGMLPDQLTGMRLPTESGQSILITSAPTTAATAPAKVQHIVVRDTNIKQEYFVENSNDLIATTSSNMMSNNNDHIRSQRTGRKCRKVYGVNNRHEWCTACRWKKACRRFPS